MGDVSDSKTLTSKKLRLFLSDNTTTREPGFYQKFSFQGPYLFCCRRHRHTSDEPLVIILPYTINKESFPATR